MTIPFATTPEQRVNAAGIATEMRAAGLPVGFIDSTLELARVDQGIYELMELWAESDDAEERAEIVADLQEHIDEAEESTGRVLVKPKIESRKLETVASEILAHKRKLRALIDAHGGVSEVARRAGIPQPSLSRLLASSSMPRRTTLYKIARACDVDESEVVSDWIR